MLFINILGNWFGSFGTDTQYGEVLTPPSPAVQTGTVLGAKYSTPKGGGITTAKTTKKQPATVRVFEATVENDDQGNIVLASVTEATPPSNAGGATRSAAAASSSSMGTIFAGWSLLVIGGSMVVYFYRNRFGSLTLRK